MSKSIDRVIQAAADAGLEIEVVRMGESTRTADEAAAQCGCAVAQIVKSLIFEGAESKRLYLFLVSGSRKLDTAKASRHAGEDLKRADPRRIREETGFAIGGVSPLGQPASVLRYADVSLLEHDVVWAAAGAHDAVFSAAPAALIAASKAVKADIAA